MTDTSSSPYVSLLPYVLTLHERNIVITQTNSLLEMLYQQKGTLKTLLAYTFSEETASVLQEILDKQSGHESSMDLEHFFRELEEYLLSLPLLRMSVAFIPTREVLKIISQHVRSLIDTHAVLDVQVDELLLAGVTIEYKGVYKDYTYSHVLESAMQKRKAELLSLLT